MLQSGYTQNQVVAKMIMPQNGAGNLVKLKTGPHPYHTHSKIIYAPEPADNTAFFFNDQPVLKLKKNRKWPVLLLTQLSFNDVLENSMNGLNPALISTYDDHITELFKDAPSLFKLKFVLPL